MKGKLVILPKKKPTTIGQVLACHKKLLSECLEHEIRKQISESSIEELNCMIRETTPFLKDDLYKNAAKLKFKSVNVLMKKEREDLLFTKKCLEVIYDTKETILHARMKSCIGIDRQIESMLGLKKTTKRVTLTCYMELVGCLNMQ